LDVTTKISDYQNRPVQTGTEKKVSRTSEAAATSPGEAAASGSPVRITDQARQLASLEQAVSSLPVVNEARVQEIRLSIDEGRYQISPERIADKLLRTEQELGAR
jgi:negative regulator of flagellin synthesis FlgM